MFLFKKNLFVRYLTHGTVKSYLVDNEVLGLQFDNGIKFAIDNNYRILNSKETNYNDLIGSKVTRVIQIKELFKLIFDTGIIIEVGLKAEDYNGPEALRMYLTDGSIIIE